MSEFLRRLLEKFPHSLRQQIGIRQNVEFYSKVFGFKYSCVLTTRDISNSNTWVNSLLTVVPWNGSIEIITITQLKHCSSEP